MHIADGVAPLPVAVAAALLALAGTAAGLKKLEDEHVPRAALIAAAVFVISSLVRLPLGVSSVHPALCGLAGLLLGWSVFPVYLVCLFLQTFLLQVGGISTLGINTLIMSLPGVMVYYLFRHHFRSDRPPRSPFLIGAAAGTLGLLSAFVIWTAALLACGRELEIIAKFAFFPHLGITAAEAVFTGFMTSFLYRTRPDMFA